MQIKKFLTSLLAPIFPLLFLLLLIKNASAYDQKVLDLMSYNVENLFDNVHDEGKDDYTFLPGNHPGKKKGCPQATTPFYRKQCYDVSWSNEKLDLKLHQIRDIILKERDNLPDILALYEIENENVLKKLAKVLGYTEYFITNGPDARGIDVALLYKPRKGFQLKEKIEYDLHALAVTKLKTRPILEMVFQIGRSELLSVFVNHWPSQANPSQDRLKIAQHLMKVVKERLKNPAHKVVALGDFNVLEKETPHPLRQTVLNPSAPLLFDLRLEKLKVTSQEEMDKLPPGSHFYSKDKSWSHLDKILVSANLLEDESGDASGTRIDVSSFNIYAPEFATTHFKANAATTDLWEIWPRFLVPKRYDFMADSSERAGFSDHFPLTVQMKF